MYWKTSYLYICASERRKPISYIFFFSTDSHNPVYFFFVLGKNFRTFLRVIKYSEDKHSTNILVKYMTIDVFIAQKFLWQLYFEASCLKGQGMSFCSGLSYL